MNKDWLNGSVHDAGRSLTQIVYRRRKGEADEILARRPERRSGDGRYASIFEQDSADFFRADTRVTNVDPGVERACGRFAAESGNFIQVMNE